MTLSVMSDMRPRFGKRFTKSRLSRLPIGRGRIVFLLEPRAAGTIRFAALTNAEYRMPSTIRWQSAERVGKSTVGANILGYVIDREPCDLLWVMPSREAMADFLKDEIEPMIRANPSLEKKIGLGRQPRQLGRTNNTRRKSFQGGTATFVGGASASPLAFRTVRVVVLDEIDKLRILVGEGDADALASKRVSTYGTDFKILRFSKPTLEGSSRINRHFSRGSIQGDHYPECLEYVRTHRFKCRLHAVRGYGGAKTGGGRSFGILRNTYVDKTTGVTVQNVDTDVGKSQLASMLARKEPGPGYVHLPCGVHGEVAGGWDIEAIAELTAEYRREQNLRGYTITRWYKRMGRANHRLDCFLYALAALAMSRLKIDGCALQRTEAKNVGEESEKKKERPFKWGVQPASVNDPLVREFQREHHRRRQGELRWGALNKPVVW
jgi:phage terminase large subunit GpA-like protein